MLWDSDAGTIGTWDTQLYDLGYGALKLEISGSLGLGIRSLGLGMF